MRDIPTLFAQGAKRAWRMEIIPSINQGLQEIADLKVTSTTILSNNDPIIINTSLKSTDAKSKEVGERIENLVKEFFQYDQINKSFPGSYEIYVQSKDNKKIN